MIYFQSVSYCTSRKSHGRTVTQTALNGTNNARQASSTGQRSSLQDKTVSFARLILLLDNFSSDVSSLQLLWQRCFRPCFCIDYRPGDPFRAIVIKTCASVGSGSCRLSHSLNQHGELSTELKAGVCVCVFVAYCM